MPTRAEVVALSKSGFSHREIAATLHCSKEQVAVQTYIARRRKELPPLDQSVAPYRSKPVYIRDDTYEVLRQEAAKRNTTPGLLSRALLETIASDNLFVAILGGKNE